MRNNNQENTIRQAKSKRNFHPYDYRVRLPIKKELIKKHIEQTILDYGQFSKSRPTIAKMFGVSQRYVTKIYSETNQDPSYDVSHKQGFTVRIKFSCLSKSSQAEIFHLSNKNRNNKKDNPSYSYNTLSLSINTPISPIGGTAVLKNKPRKEKKTINEEREALILELGRKYKWHFKNQTLKLFAYPTYIIKKASEELSSAIEEYERERQCIRSTYRYMKKLLDIFMQRAGLSPLWILYYRKLKNPPQYKNAGQPTIAPSLGSAASLPRYKRPYNSTGSLKVGDILKELLAPQNTQTKSSVAESYSATKVNAHKTLRHSPNVKFEPHAEEKIAEFKRMLVGASGTRDSATKKVLVEYIYRCIFNEKPTDDKLKEYGFS